MALIPYLMLPVWGIFLLSGLLCVFCGIVLNQRAKPQTSGDAYEFKTIYTIQLVSGVVLLASIFNIWIGPNIRHVVDNSGTFWLYTDGILIILLLKVTKNRMFGVYIGIVTAMFCIGNYLIADILDVRKLHRPERILYIQWGFVWNTIECLLLIWGMHHVKRISNALPRASRVGYTKLASFGYLAYIRGKRVFELKRIRIAKKTRI